jgi:predicted sugar kinase
MQQIELTTPSCLLLGLAHAEGQICQLGITLQYPPIQLLARASAVLSITGGRADLARRQAERFYASRPLSPAQESAVKDGEAAPSLPLSPAQGRGLGGEGEVEIELAIPQFMGLGSGAMLGLSVARALAALHGLPAKVPALAAAISLTNDEALEAQAFAQGGLLLVDDAGDVRRRHEIAQHDEADDWVFVLVLPHVPASTPETLEADMRRMLNAAAGHLSAEAGSILAWDLWPALERDDIAAFAQALMAIQALNYAALADAGRPVQLTADAQAILDIMRDSGALAWGRAMAGLGLYGLIKGGGPSRVLRRALTAHLGYFGGTVMATLCDNRGAQIREM